MINNPLEYSDCVIWLDGSDTTSLFQLSGGTTAVAANLDPVGYWGDKSGNNRHFTNIGGSATTRPTWVSSLSTVRFDGTNDTLSTRGFTLDFFPKTVFLVITNNAPVSQSTIFGQWGANVGWAPVIHQHYHGAPILAYISHIHTPIRLAQINYRSLSAFDVLCHVNNGTIVQNSLNGFGGNRAAYTEQASVSGIRLGVLASAGTGNANVGSGGYFNGDISEVIVYNRALTDFERADVEYYLTRKWSVLNSIPRQVYALKSGNWSTMDWSVSAEPSPWNVPIETDNVYTNTFLVTADISTKVDTIRNSTLAPNIPSGGSFMLANGVSLSANVFGGVGPYTLTLLPAASATLVGNITGGPVATANGTALFNNYLNLIGDVRGGTNATAHGLILSAIPSIALSSSRVDVQGSIFGAAAAGINNTTTGTLNVNQTGSIFGAAAAGINNTTTGTLNINCSLPIFASTTGVSFNNASTGTINLTAVSLIPNNLRHVYISPNISGVNRITSNIINAPNGRQAIYAPRYQVFPTGSAQYTRHAVNGYDSFVDYWTPDATFSYPPVSSVKLNQTYANSLSSGLMNVPPTSAIAFNSGAGPTNVSITQLIAGERYQITDNSLGADFVRCGAENSNVGTKFTALSAGVGIGRARTLGKAYLDTQNSVWDTLITSLSSNQLTMGMILKDAATTPAISAIVSSMNLENY